MVAAKMMRRVLVNHAVARRRRKRGGASAVLVSLTHAGGVPDRSVDMTDLDEALTALGKMKARKGQIVELRFFDGLTAEVLGVSLRIVHRDWDFASVALPRAERPERRPNDAGVAIDGVTSGARRSTTTVSRPRGSQARMASEAADRDHDRAGHGGRSPKCSPALLPYPLGDGLRVSNTRRRLNVRAGFLT